MYYSWGDLKKKSLFTDKRPITYQSKDATKVQYGESMSFIEVTYRLQVRGQRSRNDSKTAVPPKAHPSMDESQKPGIYRTTFLKFDRLESASFRWLSSFKSFPGSSAGLRVAQQSLLIYTWRGQFQGCHEAFEFTFFFPFQAQSFPPVGGNASPPLRISVSYGASLQGGRFYLRGNWCTIQTKNFETCLDQLRVKCLIFRQGERKISPSHY